VLSLPCFSNAGPFADGLSKMPRVGGYGWDIGTPSSGPDMVWDVRRQREAERAGRFLGA